MNFKTFCKSIMSGMFFPAVFLTFTYSILWSCNITNFKFFPAQFLVMYIPMLFGITNVIHLWVGDSCPIKNYYLRLWVTGGILGVIVSTFGVFVLNIPSVLFNVSGIISYLPLIFLPIIYGAIFRYIINWLNKI